MNFKNFFQSKTFGIFLIALGGCALALIIFRAGMFVGYHKAAFSYRWGDSYYKAFGRPERNFPMNFSEELTPAHGAIGRIIKVNLPTVLLEERNQIEKSIIINASTTILRFRETLKPTDLQVDDMAVVIGSPDSQGQIDATLIRIMPPEPLPYPQR